MMSSDPPSPHHTTKSTMARSPKPSILADGLVFAGGVAVALLLFWALYALLAPSPASSLHPSTKPFAPIPTTTTTTTTQRSTGPTFYDDHTLSYTIDRPLTNWDAKRRHWLSLHPELPKNEDRVVMVTGSQPVPCRNPIGDHLLFRFFKNKVDYCRRHNIPLFYNTVLLDPRMFAYWAKIPALRAAMVAHPEAEWLWWVDSDAALTDMDAPIPLHRYRRHNLVVHGWPDLVFTNKSWTALNAGVFLIRNCQWSLDFMNVWASFGPQSPNYDRWGKTLRTEFKDKMFPESDDQSALVYLLLRHNSTWGDKIYLENEYYFEGYWVEIVGRLEAIAARYLAMERRTKSLRRRRAEVEEAWYGRLRNGMLEKEGWGSGLKGWWRPFITHFTGCQPCSGDHSGMYSGENCFEGMEKALNFADDQVLRAYGFRHYPGMRNTSAVRPVPFDYPAGAGAGGGG